MTLGFFAGFNGLRAQVPALRSRAGIAMLAAFALFAGGIPTIFFLLVDKYFPEWMPDGEILVLALGFLILSRFFSQKARYKSRYGNQAYSRAMAAFVIPGLGILFACIAHLAYIPGPHIPDLWWRPILMVLGWFTVAIGAGLWWRAVNALGADYLAMLYVYHPENRRMVDSNIYQLVRHPIYAAALHMSTGLALIHANWYALLVALVIPLFFFGWIRLVEELELIDQIPGYRKYRGAVPAFIPRLRNLVKFWRLLVMGG